ncbi:MAG TPA: hypothetical protein PKM57_06275 [Kiritimatiellia bacterium]|nr:hypothetical protein [Kiritimatiellia bacterium]HPS06897.1 hypothetical protein [Kiritimatiellia bacterium]
MKTLAQTYHHERRGNCAQSVAFAWNARNPGAEVSEEAFAGCGGGRAPGGLCGALHASCELAGADAAEAVKRGFAEKTAGKLTCKEIRASKTLTCNACVGLASELLEKQLAAPQKT